MTIGCAKKKDASDIDQFREKYRVVLFAE